MKVITALKLRNRLGEVLDQVRFTKTPVWVYKNEKPVAKIVPVPQPNKVDKEQFLKKYRQLISTLPKKYQVGDLDPDLLEVLGSGAQVSLEEEEDVVYQYLKEKHG